MVFFFILALISAILIYVFFLGGRGKIYDIVIVKMTSRWYQETLSHIKPNSRVLDIGIGTGAALLANKDTVIEKNLTVHGVDYDKDYIDRCNLLIQRSNMSKQITAVHDSIYDFNVSKISSGPLYDVGYFSGSLMIMPDPVRALKKVHSLLAKPTNSIFVTQTFTLSCNKSFLGRLTELFKPLLKILTTIDFGQVTYESAFRKTVDNAGLEIVRCEVIKPNTFWSSIVADKNRVYKLMELKQK